MQRLKVYLLIKNRQAKSKQPSRTRKAVADASARVILAFFSFALCTTLIAAGFFYAWLSTDLPSIEQLPVLLDQQKGELLQPTRLLDRTGTQVLATLGESNEKRAFLSINPDESNHFSLQLVRLLVAALDPIFWSDDGVDTNHLLDPQPHTIAERLVRNLLLADEVESQKTTLRMKLLARQVTLRYGRTQVLEWYLNSADFGHETFGADNAAHVYLNKSAADLDLAEAALMVSLVEFPALNPLDAPAAAIENQQKLLKDLFDQSVLSFNEYSQANEEKLKFAAVPSEGSTDVSGFVQYAKHQLENLLGANRIARGGLDVITTLDVDLQAQLQCASDKELVQIVTNQPAAMTASEDCRAASYLPTQKFNWEGGADLLTSSLILDPKTGQILAYSSPYSLTPSITTPEYQPGSLLSPFVALAAFARGSSPASLVWDAPSTLPAGLVGFENPDGIYHGPVNYRLALANDYVVPIAGIFNQIDAQTIWVLAASAGLSAPEQEKADAKALFSGVKTDLFEIAQAYGTLAANGTKNGLYNPQSGMIEPSAILQVLSSSGQIILDASQPQQSAVISTSLSYLINSVLSDEDSRWPSLGHPNSLEIGKTAAVKIGQVQGKDQVWTVGYTPNKLVLTWFGASSTENSNSNLDPRMAEGLWRALIQYATTNDSDESWIRPLDVNEIQVCSPSGMLPTAICPDIISDVFIAGNEPTQVDTLYQKVKINRETGLLATIFTPSSLVEERTFINVPDSLRNWASSAGLAVPPQGYDTIPVTQTNPLLQISSPALFSPVSGKVQIYGSANIENFSSYTLQFGQGINPDTWQQIGDTQTRPVENGELAEWDTTGLEGLYVLRLTVVQQDNQIQTAVIQVTVDNTPPVISVISPFENSQLTPDNGIILLSADVSDNVAIARVEFWLDGRKIGERVTAPFTLLWLSVNGNHSLHIKAFDTAGNEKDTETIDFSVTP